jgi:hypothetical protein
MKSILCLFVLLVLLSTAGFASAADGDITRVSPDQNISISEGDSQVFSISIANTDPANLTYTIKWYVDDVEKQSTTVSIGNKLFLAVSEVVSATVGIVPGIVNLIIGIVPIIITLSLVSLLTGIFGAIIYAIRKGI